MAAGVSPTLLVVSHKECWADPRGSGYVTVGGFPQQMAAISTLFAETRLMIALRPTEPPPGAKRLEGHRLTVDPLPEPAGRGGRRKLSLLWWLPRHGRRLWRAVRSADAVHAPVPGDLGTLGLLIALLQRRRLWVRHCGTWGHRATAADRFLAWLLPRIAGGRTVVMATGGGETPPCSGNPAVTWIFSTTLGRDRLASLPRARPWQPEDAPRLIQVGRLTAGKNVASTLRAMPGVLRRHPGARLDVAGDGPALEGLRSLSEELGLERHVTFHGNLAHREVLDLLADSHLFLFPTRVAEGFPKAVLEAMACGLPVLVPRVSVLPHLVAGGAGLVLADTDPETVARAVLDALADPRQLAAIGRQARRRAQGYSLESWRDRIRQRLEEAWGSL